MTRLTIALTVVKRWVIMKKRSIWDWIGAIIVGLILGIVFYVLVFGSI